MQKGHALLAFAVAAALFAGAPSSAFATDTQGRSGIDGAAEALRNELSPMLLTYENLQKARGVTGSIDISSARVQGLQDVMYDGNPVEPTITLKLENKALREGKDFDVTSEGDNINPGTVSVTITGKGAYGGTIETGFTILPGDLAYATIDVIADQTKTGEPLCPAPTVELEGKTLVEDVDYTVSYEDNVEEGTAMLVVAGIGNCTGQQHATFEILEGPEEGQEQQSDLMAALPFVAGPAAVAAVALGIVMVTLFRRKPAK